MPLADADFIVLSHLRCDWVWQRPQHLVSRIGRGRRTWFVEEPRLAEVDQPTIRMVDAGPVTRIWVDTPVDSGIDEYGVGAEPLYTPFLLEFFRDVPRDVWLYAPTALPIATALEPRILIYDVMDDLAGFADAPPEMVLLMRRAVTTADVVFAGGRSLHRSAVAVRGSHGTHAFPSGVECDHYARSRQLRHDNHRHVAGYVGVIDERLDLDLIARLAQDLPNWEIHIVGPTTKIEPASLPQAENIRYLGMKQYDELPGVMAQFDVALMPFALNEATRLISPTKTLEYLAARLPVVSTRVPDVVADWSSVVHLADTGAEFAAACQHVVAQSRAQRDQRVAPLRRKHEWDVIAAGMVEILEAAVADRSVRAASAETAPAQATA